MKQHVALLLATTLLFGTLAPAQVREGECENNPFPDRNPGPGTLKAIPVPTPTDLSIYVNDRKAAIALGKALFWDQQVGSDGIQACASCHFRAGADPRSINQLAPGGLTNSNTRVDLGINSQLKDSDFPFHKVSDPTNRKSTVLRSSQNVASSHGVKLGRFIGVNRGESADIGTSLTDTVFNVAGIRTRRVEPRNTPTVINAAFNRRQLWDGRADNIFNGVNEFGVRDPNARVLKTNGFNAIEQVKIRIDNASLASQAVGPPVSDLEMSFAGRDWKDIGKRLLRGKPLRNQSVSADDSVLSEYVKAGERGLNTTYQEMIEKAFQITWWRSNLIVTVSPSNQLSFITRPNRPLLANEYTMAEYNFSLFFGLAVQMYEMTLISDDSPVDRYFDGNTSALNAQQLRGLSVFTGNAACAACHAGAETTNASSRILLGAVVNGVKQPGEIIERMFNGQCETVIYDQSFYNIGVRPTEEDLGIGRNDPFGNPLSIADLLTTPPSLIPSKELLTFRYPNVIGSAPTNPPLRFGERTSTKGAFKVPSLRNLDLTAPYFHNGGQATIRQAIEFYNRGGDFRERNVQFIDFEIGKLNLTEQQIQDLEAFLRALTDERVIRQSAPFDHPELTVTNGHPVNAAGIPFIGPDGGAKDNLLVIPAVGRQGNRSAFPKGFLEK
jgi:cytochrome c peroxidase